VLLLIIREVPTVLLEEATTPPYPIVDETEVIELESIVICEEPLPEPSKYIKPPESFAVSVSKFAEVMDNLRVFGTVA